MNKFENYCASYITPQMTLLEKIHAIIKYLKENPTLNLYQCSQNYSSSQLEISTLVNPSQNEIMVGDLVAFKDCKVSTILTVGSGYFTVSSEFINYKGDKGDKGDNGEDGEDGLRLYKHSISIEYDTAVWNENAKFGISPFAFISTRSTPMTYNDFSENFSLRCGVNIFGLIDDDNDLGSALSYDAIEDKLYLYSTNGEYNVFANIEGIEDEVEEILQ